MPLSCKRGLLNLLREFVYFLKPYLRYTLLALDTNVTGRGSSQEILSTPCENPDFHESTKFMGLLAHVFCLFTPVLLIGLTCLQAQWRLTVVFWRRKYKKSWRMLSEPLQAATSLCCSLLGNAGRAPNSGFAECSAFVSAHTQSDPLYENGHLCILPQSIAVETGPHQGLLG